MVVKSILDIGIWASVEGKSLVVCRIMCDMEEIWVMDPKCDTRLKEYRESTHKLTGD